MTENVNDAKGTSGNPEVGQSSGPDVRVIDPMDNKIVSTVEGLDDTKPGVTDDAAKAEAEKAAAAKAEAEKAETEKAEKAKGDAARYDKDPDWQRMKRERDDAVAAKAKAEAEADLLKKGYKPPEAAPETLPFVDPKTKTKEELIEWMEEDPHGYAENMRAMARYEAEQIKKEAIEAESRNAITKSVEETFTSYSKDNPTFDKMWESGEIQQFMEQHPGHNAISAHMILSKGSEAGTAEEKIQAAVAKAIKETEDKMLANFKAKRNAAVLDGGGQGGVPPDKDAELKDTKTSGGLTSVLAGRLRQMRQGS